MLFMKISCGFEHFYLQGGLLFLKQMLYGVKNAAKAFLEIAPGDYE